jgi:PBP1b-binding outer membrane lipoprotein LpoB
MRRIILALTLSLSLTGCANLQAITDGISLATKSIANPVTPADEAQVEVALDAAIDLLRAYKQACAAGTADVNCRANVAQIQPYTRQVKPLIAQLRSFVDNNDQINAAVIYNQLRALYVNVKATASQLGVNLGSSTI